MAHYIVKARITVDVEMEIETTDEKTAREIFDGSIAMNATLVDTPDEQFDVSEDSISEMEITSVEAC